MKAEEKKKNRDEGLCCQGFRKTDKGENVRKLFGISNAKPFER